MAESESTLKKEAKSKLEQVADIIKEEGLYLGLFYDDKAGQKCLVVTKTEPKSDEERFQIRKDLWAKSEIWNRPTKDDFEELERQEIAYVFSWHNVTADKVFIAPNESTFEIIEKICFKDHTKSLALSVENAVEHVLRASKKLS